METDNWWNNKLQSIDKSYPYSKEIINEVAYGMVLYSKFSIEQLSVNYFNNDNVPSIESMVTLPNGKKIILHCIHPVPPTHYKNLPDNDGPGRASHEKVGTEN